MKSALALSLSTLSTLFAIAKADSLTLFNLVPTGTDAFTDSFSIPSPTAWVDPIGTASDGSETTYIYNEIDSGEAGFFGDATGSNVATTSFTLIASASGFRLPNIESMSAECKLDSPNSGGCVYVAPEDVGGTSLVTVGETGFSASAFEISISAPTQAAASGSSSGSGSGSGAASGSGSGSGSAATGSAKNGALSMSQGSEFNVRLLGLVASGLLVGFFAVL